MSKHITTTKIIENKQIAPDIFDLRIHSPVQVGLATAGQFLGIYTGNAAMLLPRPLSICEIDPVGGTLRVIYRVVGGGTREIAGLGVGDTLRVLGPLGNGYAIDPDYPNVAIVGGGLGVPPLLGLAASIRAAAPGVKIAVYLGFRDKSQVILVEDFWRFVDEITVCTDDGSLGVQGNAVAAFRQGCHPGLDPGSSPGQCPTGSHIAMTTPDIIYGCGPKPMLKALSQYAAQAALPCYVSVEEHMACCVGTCLACAVKLRQNDSTVAIKRACCDGPVFNAREVVW